MNLTNTGLIDSKVGAHNLSSLPSGSDTFHVSLHGADQYCRVLDSFDPFARRNAAWMRKGATDSETQTEALQESSLL
jgi:hypothetical protein